MFLKYKLKRSAKKAKEFLISQVLKGKYGLSCHNQFGSPMYSHNKGHLFSTFFISDTFKNELPEVVRSIFISRILSEKTNEMWGYSPRSYFKGNDNNRFIVDTDDTAFALRTLRNLDIYHSPQILTNYAHRVSHESNNYTLFSTFKSLKASSIVSYPTFKNNLEIHPEVNANIYHLLVNTDYDDLISISFIEKLQNENGSWPSYFYPNPFYASYQFIALLSKVDPNNSCIKKACDYLLHEVEKSNYSIDNFSLGLVLNCFQIVKEQAYDSSKQKLTALAFKRQEKNGSWKSAAKIWQFTDEEDQIWQAEDVNSVITTSLILKALQYIKVGN